MQYTFLSIAEVKPTVILPLNSLLEQERKLKFRISTSARISKDKNILLTVMLLIGPRLYLW